MKNKHMDFSQRCDIEKGLINRNSIRKIAMDIGKSHCTVLYEIKVRKVFVKGNSFNLFPGSSNECNKLLKSPYVCNGCDDKRKCRKNKWFYFAKDSQIEYKTLLIDSRSGIDMECDEFNSLCKILDKEVTEQGHSFYMVKINHPEIINGISTLYSWQRKGYLSTKNIDLPRQVRYKTRKKQEEKDLIPYNSACRENRTYDDFKKYIKENNIRYYFQMDTVEGKKGSAVLLTFGFITTNFFLAFKLDSQTIKCVNEKISYLKTSLGLKTFYKMFPVGLTDNGSEFKSPEHIEFNGFFTERTKLFYCDPRRSDQKGTLEVLHEYPRRFIPKGQDISSYTDEDILKMVNNINSVPRASLNGETPYEMMSEKIGAENLLKLGLIKIENTDVVLNDDIFKKEN
jgi:IS30 family transposase